MIGAHILLVEVLFHEGRYHGVPDWPPSPARLFQALVAGSARSERLSESHEAALRWLERQAPPIIAAPRTRMGAEITLYVPNNDLDAKGGDPDRVADIRSAKNVRPRIFDRETPILYGWEYDPAVDAHADAIAALAASLYQLGRGIDLASARTSLVDREVFNARLETHAGPVLRPTPGSLTGARQLLCPSEGTIDSLYRRHSASLQRFRVIDRGKKQIFSQPPKAYFERVAYGGLPRRSVFDLRAAGDSFAAQPLARAGALVEEIRDAAAARLLGAAPSLASDIERALIGRAVEGLPKVSTADRVRLVPLPSIGHEHVTPAIRRLLVEIPGGCPLDGADVFWAFAGLRVGKRAGDPESHAIDEDEPRFELTPASEADNMLRHYGVTPDAHRWARRWRTITPAALPVERRRLDRTGESNDAKGADERLAEEMAAVRAVRVALRHAGITAHLQHIAVQREPFSRRGQRAETFAAGTRFSKHGLWHVELRFETPQPGPLVIGNGRFLGLGLMAPVRAPPSD
ncbi:MAG: type I-U CRISPR-associated protein Csb2 [Haliangiales bacterium]